MVAVHDDHTGTFAVHEETDLALLDQHLLKTNTLSKRMTTILSRLDTRLSRLDKTVGPLGIKDMSRTQSNIDAALNILGPGLVPAPNGIRPSTSRQGSYGSTLNGTGAQGGSQGGSTAPSIRSMNMDSGVGLGISGAGAAPNPSLRHTREPSASTPVSVMDRARAVPRTDVLPRWSEVGGPGSSASASAGRTSQASQRSPALDSLARSPAVDSPRSAGSQLSVAAPNPPHQSPSASSTGGGGERAILTRGIDPMSIGEFFGAMEAVIQDIELMQRGIDEGRVGQRETGISELCTLLEDSYAQAAELLMKTVKDTVPPPFDPAQYASSTPQLATYYPPYTSIRSVASRLATIAYPAQPTPRSAQVVTPIQRDLTADIASIRGDWLRRSFHKLVGKIDDADATRWEGRGSEKVRLCMAMWEAFLNVAESEAAFAAAIWPGIAGQKLAAETLSYPLGVVSQTMNNILSGFKRSLYAQTMTLLDLYASLVAFQPRYEESTATQLPDAKEVQGALTGTLNTMRGLALRSFPERLVDIRTPPRGGPPITAVVSETTFSTIAYLEGLPAFGGLVEKLLRSSSGQAERAWLMGASAPPSTAKSAASEGGVLNLYAADVLGTLLQSLESQAKQVRRPVGSTFLLNNVSHIRNAISSFKDDIIGPGAEDMLNRAFRDAKTSYIGEWKVLTAALQITAQPRFNVPMGGGHSDKQSTKEAAAAFFERLADLEATTRQHPLARGDPELRERAGREVEELVRGPYQAFWNKGRGRYDKYLRATPDEVGSRVRALFR